MSTASSAVTYTSVYTDSEPRRVFWGAEEELSDGEDGSVDHPMDGGDDGDDDDGDSSGYDADDEDEDEEDEKEEEHLALADSAIVIPIDELVSLPKGTEPIIPPPSTDTATTGEQTSISLPQEAEVERLLAMPTPSPSPLTSLSPPLAEERLARCTAPTALPPPPLPPSLYPSPPVDRKDDIPESKQPPRKRLCLSTLGSRYKVGESFTRGRGDLYALLEDAQDGDSIDRGGGGLCYPRGLGSFGRVKPETLRVMRDMRREMSDMQAELLALHGQSRRAGQPGGDVRVLDNQDAPRDTDSHI
nr:hypothetical protein [Tanacetum cinerariifolium]